MAHNQISPTSTSGSAKLPDFSTTPNSTGSAPQACDTWYYPPLIAHDLDGIDLPDKAKAEALTCGWEYSRCIIPSYSNWDRYIAFVPIMVLATVSECYGHLVDLAAGDKVLNYDLGALIDTLFKGTLFYEDMARECRCNLLFLSEKASDRRNGELFRRYTNTLAVSPKQWFRMRDTNALLRFSIGAAIVCNSIVDLWFSNDQLEILSEIGFSLYDAVAFYKHRSEGETHSTFSYFGEDLRIRGYQQSRELLWALDAAWANQPERLPVLNLVRIFGGTIHMLMRRYRFVEDGLMIGKPETEEVVALTQQHFKLWNRVETTERSLHQDTSRYEDILSREKLLLYPGLAAAMESGGKGCCDTCLYRTSFGATVPFQFSGVQLCGKCRVVWREYLELLPERAFAVFPELSAMKVSLS